MRAFKPVLDHIRSGKVRPDTVPSDRLITPATVMTLSRPVLAGKASLMLVRGERYVTPIVAAAAATDMEGNVARLIDKLFPNSGLGVSTKGAQLDPVADTAAVLEIASAALIGPGVSLAGKAAVTSVMGQEGFKSVWALMAASKYRKATISETIPNGEMLAMPIEQIGAEAMAEKLWALVLAVATNDVDPGPLRTTLGLGALAFAAVGVTHGEQARSSYVDSLAEMMASIDRRETI